MGAVGFVGVIEPAWIQELGSHFFISLIVGYQLDIIKGGMEGINKWNGMNGMNKMNGMNEMNSMNEMNGINGMNYMNGMNGMN